MTSDSFAAEGFVLVPEVLSGPECAAIAGRIHLRDGAAGTRSLLAEAWCGPLARRLASHPILARIIPAGHVAVQCTWFEKSASRNWLVPVHQDLSVPVAAWTDAPGLRGWSEKEGELFVQPPVSLLEMLIAVRLHLDPCQSVDGPLRVVPASHTGGVIDEATAAQMRRARGEVVCEAATGSALVLRPLLLHASSKSSGSSRRRVLQFLFGPREPGQGLRWRQAL